MEGNYLLMNEGIWKEIAEQFEEKWYLDCPVLLSSARLISRHVQQSPFSLSLFLFIFIFEILFPLFIFN